MLVLRPADSAETTIAWEMAMNEKHAPSVLILSRQDIHDLPSVTGDRYREAQGTRQGGYVVMDSPCPAVVLVGNGSEVSLLCEVATLLEAEDIKARVVSVPSIGLFNRQSKEYRQSVLPAGVPMYGLTAGVPATLRMIRDFDGTVQGMERFGASAPYKVLDEKFGFTPDQVLDRVKKFLGL